MRIACSAGSEQNGHCASLPSHTRLAHSMQKKLWPHGTSACVTLPSLQTKHFAELSSESAGLVLFAGDGRDGTDEAAAAGLGYDQMLLSAVEESKLGESPSPSSRSFELQIAPRSPRPPELEDDDEHEPELEKAPVLPVDEVMLGNASACGSM